jgi:hypothetical protein
MSDFGRERGVDLFGCQIEAAKRQPLCFFFFVLFLKKKNLRREMLEGEFKFEVLVSNLRY